MVIEMGVFRCCSRGRSGCVWALKYGCLDNVMGLKCVCSVISHKAELINNIEMAYVSLTLPIINKKHSIFIIQHFY